MGGCAKGLVSKDKRSLSRKMNAFIKEAREMGLELKDKSIKKIEGKWYGYISVHS